MTFLCRVLLMVSLALAVAPVRAQEKKKKPPPLRIEKVQLGLPVGAGDTYRLRVGAWSPVYVELEAGENDIGQGDYDLVGETSDGESQIVFTSAAPAIAAERTRIALTYYRPGDRNGRLTLSLRKRNGTTVQTVTTEPSPGAMLDSHEVLYLSLGSPLAGLRKALMPRKPVGDEEEVKDDVRAERSLAFINEVELMPTRWFGYQAADAIVLSTGNTRFVQELRQNEAALAALREWLRRGGRLVLSAGRNYQAVRELLPRLGLTDFTLEKSERTVELSRVKNWAHPGAPAFPGQDGIDVVRVSVRDGVLPLATDDRDGKAWPILALSTTGTGRVLFVAFDFDAPAFARWQGQTQFWERIHSELAPRQAGLKENREDTQLAARLQRALENFEEVPVISFGWVAFFILIYIIIVGPLDYWFLKKVVKRLELTWVTFPLVVLIVSVAAYFTAYKLKGNHMRINKIDVVDINLRDGEVQGTTWLALFSPRVQAYTVGIAPSPDWIGGAKEDEDYGALVGTMNTPEDNRTSSQSFFRRPSSYAEDAKGLKGVAVPVWASRSFTASWRTKVDPASRLVEVKDFGPSRDGQRLIGTLTSHLPVELTEVSLLYNGSSTALDNLPAGGAYTIAKDIQVDRNLRAGNLGNWFQEPYHYIAPPKQGKTRRGDFSGDKKKPSMEEPDMAPGGHSDDQRATGLMKPLLFFSHNANPWINRNNSGLRTLDLGWRIQGVHTFTAREEPRFLDEAILVGRVVQTPAAAETVTLSGVSPTRLWLGTLPGEGEREPLQGFLGQDTYVRIYIPVSR